MAVKKCEDLMHYSGHIDNLIDKKIEKQKSDSHLRLIATIDCVRFLLYQPQPFRGHDESEESDNRGNFIELLTLLSHYNHDLAQVVLENAPKNQKYTSPTIQKDIIRIFANKVRNAILEEVGNAKFCIIVDEARDESKREQMAIILRFVDKMGCIRERFFAIVHVKDTRASTLKDSICDVLTHNNLQVENIRGQGYDGASNMCGVWNGLQALICRECPYAYYVHCFAHRLQLALVTASREVHAVHEFFGQMTYIINVVVGSTKRHDELRNAQAIELEKLVAANEIQTGREKNQIGTLLRAGDTRWSSHYRCICCLIKMYNASLTVLLNMKNEGRDYEVRGDAAVAMKMMETFEFILCLHLMEEIMGITNILSQALQLQTQDILNAVDLVTTCKSLLQKMRDVGWEPLLAKVLSFCERNNIDIPDLSNLCSNLRGLPHRRNQNSITLEHHLRIALFIASVDFQLRELNSRFSDSSLEILVLSSALNPRDGFKSFEVNKLCILADKFYPEDFSEQERVQLRLQLEYYGLDVIKHPELLNLSSTSDLCQKLYMTKKSVNYHLIDRLIRLVLTLPASTATTE